METELLDEFDRFFDSALAGISLARGERVDPTPELARAPANFLIVLYVLGKLQGRRVPVDLVRSTMQRFRRNLERFRIGVQVPSGRIFELKSFCQKLADEGVVAYQMRMAMYEDND